MYRASEKTKQADMCKDPRLEMGRRAREIFDSSEGWHNRFMREVTNMVDEDMGAPNAPTRALIAMMALKEGQGISDEHLYEQARFNALTRSALGLLNGDDEVPTGSTYYLIEAKDSGIRGEEREEPAGRGV